MNYTEMNVYFFHSIMDTISEMGRNHGRKRKYSEVDASEIPATSWKLILKTKIRMLEDEEMYHCDFCQYSMNGINQVLNHVKDPAHQVKMRKNTASSDNVIFDYSLIYN